MRVMFESLETVVQRYEEITEMMSDPEVVTDTQRFLKLSKEEASIRDTVSTYKDYKDVLAQIDDTQEMLAENLDADMEALAKDELANLEERKEKLEDKLRILILPKDPRDDANIIMEVRGAAGGDEAQLFAGDLLNMYTHYADKHGWSTELLSVSMNDVGGVKEASIMIKGDKVFSRLKYENGAHRVQRVPETESQGRVHTSTATVIVMPEAEQIDVDIDMNDVRVDTYRSSGAGGQHVNKTSSAVRMTHEPTGIVVAVQDGRSQIQNREKAETILRARVADKLLSEQQSKYDEKRKLAVGTGDRSERIRTYNFPQSRVTDHRINYSSSRLSDILDGDLDEIIDKLLLFEQQEKMEQYQEEL